MVAMLKSILLWGEAPPNALDLVMDEEWISLELSGLLGGILWLTF